MAKRLVKSIDFKYWLILPFSLANISASFYARCFKSFLVDIKCCIHTNPQLFSLKCCLNSPPARSFVFAVFPEMHLNLNNMHNSFNY